MTTKDIHHEVAIPRTRSHDEIVKRSQPSLTRPRLSTETEAQLAPTEQKSAVAYAAGEDVQERLEALAKDDGVPELFQFEEPSTVHHLETTRKRLASGELAPVKP